MADEKFIDVRRRELRKVNINEADHRAAYDFANKIYKKFGNVVLSVVLFGSVAKGTSKKSSDIDLLIVVDNVSLKWDQEIVAWYRQELFEIVRKDTHKDRLHINTITLSTFWHNVKSGDPAAINIIRYGVALLDVGYFEPLKYLLYLGRVKPSTEAIYVSMNRAPWHLLRARVKVLSSMEDFYWAMVDAAHAALMIKGKTPPSPEFVGDLLREVYVSKRRLKPKYINWYEELYRLAHDIKNNKVERIDGDEFETQHKRTKEFVQEMKRLLKAGEKKSS
jgi:predicted nucleotidyltransferase/uncharacterized protein (UPF0332 family)